MKNVINDLYWETLTELNKIKKGKLLLSERLAIESAFVKLDAIKKILNISDVSMK